MRSFRNEVDGRVNIDGIESPGNEDTKMFTFGVVIVAIFTHFNPVRLLDSSLYNGKEYYSKQVGKVR